MYYPPDLPVENPENYREAVEMLGGSDDINTNVGGTTNKLIIPMKNTLIAASIEVCSNLLSTLKREIG